jgi:hypothetical protein
MSGSVMPAANVAGNMIAIAMPALPRLNSA